MTPTARKSSETYSDLYKDLTRSPVTQDLARKVDADAIKESIRNIVMTNRGERRFKRKIGCDVRYMLFENVGPDTVIILREMIRSAIEAYEPRAELMDVDVALSDDYYRATITIVFSLLNKEDPVTMTMLLERVR